MQSVQQTQHLSKADRHTYALFVAQVLAEHKYPGEAKRIKRAAEIALYPEQIQMQTDGSAKIQAQCQSGHFYTVRDDTCNCLDAGRPEVPRCKHMLALKFQRCIDKLLERQYVAEDSKDGVQGIATQLPLETEEEVWVFQPFEAPLPKYVPAWRLVLAGQFKVMEACA